MIGATIITPMGGRAGPAVIPFVTGSLALFVARGRWHQIRANRAAR